MEDDLLALEADVLGPLDEAGEVLLGGDVTTNAEGLGASLEEGVLGGLLGDLGAVRGRSGLLGLGSGGLGLYVIRGH